jgi:hypothetical protein
VKQEEICIGNLITYTKKYLNKFARNLSLLLLSIFFRMLLSKPDEGATNKTTVPGKYK